MMEYELADGSILTDEEIEKESAEYESGTWEGGFVEVRIGRPPLSDEELGVVTFKAPKSKIEAMERKARELGMSKSQFMRAVLDKAIA